MLDRWRQASRDDNLQTFPSNLKQRLYYANGFPATLGPGAVFVKIKQKVGPSKCPIGVPEIFASFLQT